jgi:hypothetical protein
LQRLSIDGPVWSVALCEWSGLTQLQELRVRGGLDTAIVRLFATHRLDQLQSLTLHRSEVSSEAIRMLTESVDTLQRLDLSESTVDDACLELMVWAKSFRRLLALDLHGSKVTEDGAWKLVKAIYLSKLRWLRIGPSSYTLGLDAIRAAYERYTEAIPQVFE